MADWGKLLEQLQGQTKAKLQALDHVQAYVQVNSLSREQVSSLLDFTPQLLSDNNFKVALKLLNCWESIATNSRDIVKPYIHGLLPPVVDRLGDNRQDVRQAACNLLLELLQVLRPDVMMERLGRFWGHKHWKVRHGLLQFVAEAVSTTGEAALVPPRDESSWVLHKVIQLVGDPESAVRDAAIECLEEVYSVYGEQLVDIITAHQLRPAHLNAIYARLAQKGAHVVLPCPSSADGGAEQLSNAYSSSRQPDSPYAGAAAYDEHDTASSTGGWASATYEQARRYDEPEQPASDSSRPGALQHGSSNKALAARQQQPAMGFADESNSQLDAGKSWGSNVAAAAGATGGAGAIKAKRGGYKDGGGVTSNGGLPPAPAISVSGERELVAELERIIDALNKGAAVDWEKRVAAMVRLEGLVKGGAAGSYEACFMEQLRLLRDPLLDQMVDRRSAVARQAAHMFHALAAALGIRLEPYAATFMGALFKGLVITVQVVSEAADAAGKGILHHCRAVRLVTQVCDVMTGDKSAKLRKHCSSFLLQIVEEWDPSEYVNHLDSVEAALTAAVQDALGETRTNGRTAFAAYAAALPERASALLKRFDSGLQQKLHEAVVAYGKGSHAVTAAVKQPKRQPAASKPWKTASSAGNNAAADPEIVIVAGPPPQGSSRPPRSASGRVPSGNGGAQRSIAPAATESAGQGHAPSMPTGAVASAAIAPASRPGRKSVAGVPMRVPGAPLLGAEGSNADMGGAVATAASSSAVSGRGRRTSVLPQRVPYSVQDAPSRPAPVAAGGPGILGRGGAGGMGMMGPRGDTYAPPATGMLHVGGGIPPDSPASYAPSDASGTAGGGGIMYEHKGVATRLFAPHPKHAAQHAALGSVVRNISSSGDDLHTQVLARDQLQQAAMQHQLQQAHAAALQHPHHYVEQQYVQDRSGSAQGHLLPAGSCVSLGAHSLQQQQQKPATLTKAVAGVLANPKDWKERVEKMNGLGDALTRQLEMDSRPEAFLDVEKVVPRLMTAMDDAHFKVSLAALALLQSCISVCPHVLESSLDKLMPLLFLKLCAAKQSIRSAAEAALQACALEMDADVLLPALIRSLEAMKQPAARVSVMEFVVLFMGEGRIAGVPTNATHMRQWISKNIPLLLDKNPNVRQMAAKSLSTMFSIDPHSVAACLQHSTPQEVSAVQRSLAYAEARAAAEEGAAAAEEAAAAAAAAAEHTASWVQHNAGPQPPSVNSSTDLSHGAAGSTGDYPYGLHSAQGYVPQGMGYSHGHGHHQAEDVAAAMAGMTLDTAVVQQQQQYRHTSNSFVGGSGHVPYGGAAAAEAAGGMQVAPVQQQPSQYQPPQQQYQGLLLHQQQQQQQQPYPQQQQQVNTQQHVSQHLPETTNPAAAGLAADRDLTPRDVLGRPVMAPAAAAQGPRAPQHLPQPLVISSMPAGPLAVASPAAAPIQQQQQQQATTDSGSEAYTGAAAMAAAAAAAAGDASSQARHLTVLVHRLQSRPAEDVLAELAACASVMCRQAWEDNFSKVLLAGLSAAQNSSEAIRELSFLLVLALAQHHGRLFEPVLDVVLQPLLQGCADTSREVLTAAQQALDVLMSVMPPLHCADILAHKLPSEASTSSGTAVDGEILCATVRCLQLVSRRMSPSELMSVVPNQLLPGLFAAFQHPRPDVRKAVVFCLVDMWHAAGEGLTPYLASLSTSQLKLLTIYYNRAQGKPQQQQADADL